MLVLAAALATLVSAAVIETQAGVTGYLTGEGHWSRARLETVYHLERYALVGNPRELALARKALPNTHAAINGLDCDSILPGPEGPDLYDPTAIIYEQAQDFFVKFSR